jgi:hypothetical protein
MDLDANWGGMAVNRFDSLSGDTRARRAYVAVVGAIFLFLEGKVDKFLEAGKLKSERLGTRGRDLDPSKGRLHSIP